MIFANSLGKVYKKQGNAVFVKISMKEFGKTMMRLEAKDIKHISSISGYDNGKEIEVVYHFTYGKLYLGIKTLIDRKHPKIPSIVKQFPGADLYERECFEMFGIHFEGNNNLNPILLGEDSPKTPLLKKDIPKTEVKK